MNDVGVRIMVMGALIGLGCSKDEVVPPARPLAPPEAIPISVGVAAADAEMGVALERNPWRTKVESFSISKHPITRAQYAQCVGAAACAEASSPNPACAEKAGAPSIPEDAPRTCVTPEQASAYCAWVGATLPTVEQWFVAARGNNVSAFSWGSAPPTCERHWLAGTNPTDVRCTGELGTPAVGKHPAGASPSGVEDVLSALSELIGKSPESRLGACAGERGCIVSSVAPGSIDRIYTTPSPTSEKYGSLAPPPAFRCVWQGGE